MPGWEGRVWGGGVGVRRKETLRKEIHETGINYGTE